MNSIMNMPDDERVEFYVKRNEIGKVAGEQDGKI